MREASLPAEERALLEQERKHAYLLGVVKDFRAALRDSGLIFKLEYLDGMLTAVESVFATGKLPAFSAPRPVFRIGQAVAAVMDWEPLATWFGANLWGGPDPETLTQAEPEASTGPKPSWPSRRIVAGVLLLISALLMLILVIIGHYWGIVRLLQGAGYVTFAWVVVGLGLLFGPAGWRRAGVVMGWAKVAFAVVGWFSFAPVFRPYAVFNAALGVALLVLLFGPTAGKWRLRFGSVAGVLALAHFCLRFSIRL